MLLTKILPLTILAAFNTPLASAKMSHEHNHEHNHEHKASSKKKAVSEVTKKQLKQIMTIYDDLHQAFFKNDKTKIEAEAKKLNNAIADIKNKEIAKLLSYSGKQLVNIKASGDRDKNNQILHSLSAALIHVLDKFDTGLKHEAYYCPMVKMKWLQNPKASDKVLNPYAPEMPNCGGKA